MNNLYCVVYCHKMKYRKLMRFYVRAESRNMAKAIFHKTYPRKQLVVLNCYICTEGIEE